MSQSLQKYITFIAEHNLPDETKYPALKGKSEEEKRAFMVQHFIVHFAKTTGKIAGAFESADHGAELKIDFLKVDLAKQLINTLLMANFIGMTEEDFAHIIETKYNDKL